MHFNHKISASGRRGAACFAFLAAFSMGFAPLAQADVSSPSAQPEKHAGPDDSNARKWAGIDGKRYQDSIRKTFRITYPDAGSVPPVSCDVTGDTHNDMIFLDTKNKKIHVVPYIPYGSDEKEVTRKISQQPGALHIDLPEGTGEYRLACVKQERGKKAVLAVANGTKIYLSTSEALATGRFTPSATYTFKHEVQAVAPMTPDVGEVGMLAVTNGTLYMFSKLKKSGETVNGNLTVDKRWPLGAEEKEPVTLTPLGGVFGDEEDGYPVGVGIPGKNLVYVISTDAEDRESAANAGTVVKAQSGAFGTALVGIGDVNGDGVDDYAVGAPEANGNAGAVAIIYGSPRIVGDITVKVDSADDKPVLRGGKAAGTLIRQVNMGKIGTSLAYIQQYDPDNPGALVISRPVHEEHPGAVIVSEKVLNKNWNTKRGLDEIPQNRIAFLASEEGGAGDGGYYVGTVPASDSDNRLPGVYTADTKGKVDVWTVDMRLQNKTTPPVKPQYPQPPAPSAAEAYKPVNETDRKSWLGEFTAGLGGALARGRCDVTGDGKPDIVSGNAVRSEYKFDPYYESSTPTHGWVFNVTGQLQIIPGGTPGGKTWSTDGIISINGPRETPDPAVDATLGLTVACAGDVNGDGVGDIIASSGGMGKVWVIYGGKDLALTDLNNLTPQRGFAVNMPPNKGAAGFQVTRVGDLDGDGLADVGFVLANTALAADTPGQYGTAFVVKGNKDGHSVDLTAPEKANRDVIWQVRTPQGHTLSAFSPIGDVNGDGVTDYALADFNYFVAKKKTVPGMAWVVYGDKSLKQVDLGKAFSGYTLEMSDDASYRLGAGNSIAPAGDVNGDGVGDFVIGFDGGVVSNQNGGGIALVHGSKEAGTKVRHLDPADISKSDKNTAFLTGVSKESGFGYAVDVLPASKDNPDALAAVGAYAQGENGSAYVLRLRDIPAGVSAVDKLGKKVTVIADSGQKSRFGRSVAFVGDVLGKPTLAVGGDAVIDNATSGEQGYAHSAHILAVAVQSVTPKDDGTGEGGGGSGSGSGTNPSGEPSGETNPGGTSGGTAGTGTAAPGTAGTSPAAGKGPAAGRGGFAAAHLGAAKPSALTKLERTGAAAAGIGVTALVLILGGIAALRLRQKEREQ